MTDPALTFPAPVGAQTEAPAPVSASTSLSMLRGQRLGQLMVAALLAMSAVAAHDALAGRWRDVIAMGLSAAVVLLCRRFVRSGRSDLGIVLFMATLTAMVSQFLWVNRGLHDSALLAYPCILLFAGVLGGWRLLLSLLGAMLLMAGTLTWANLQGWHVNVDQPADLGTLVDVAVILSVTGFSAWLITRDLRAALTSLEAENKRVSQVQGQLAHLANHDPLTGLPNRSMARDRFEMVAGRARRGDGKVALIYLDLDNFKAINDSLGHRAGDDLLCQVAQRLVGLVRETDTVCRLSGDEFLIVLDQVNDSDATASVALKVIGQFSVPFQIGGLAVTSTCSLGVALSPDDGSDFDELLRKADIAMYRAKEVGRDTFCFFDAKMNTNVVEHLQLVTGMREALLKDEFELYYQPQFDLRSGAIIGAEALIRWRHPEMGLVPPVRFIPVAEKFGLIVEIGAWVLSDACRQAMLWRGEGLGDLKVSVNLSPVQFRRGDIDRVVLHALDESGLPPQRLELELTESLLIVESGGLSDSLRRLRSLGVSFAIDDFGTGYSNLGYLKRFDVEKLKIDQSFVRRLTEDVHDEAIVRAIIQMANSLNLTTIAEGVEDAATLARLAELGCGEGQGYHWAKPLPAREFEAFVRKHRAETRARDLVSA